MQVSYGPIHDLTAGCLDDPRVTLVNDDVAMLIDAASQGYDAILLDVDNGPEGLPRRLNDDLYEGRSACRRPWRRCARAASSRSGRQTSIQIFTARLRDSGFEVSEVIVRGRGPGR